ncbi:bifunctional aspartate kinase/homoserine dehydrogenase I [Flagellimonas meridianipacifica]|uniref:Aspartate kinase n=1 Tax=Flagellimonas meridianipacifica TaxID=1080225 RepID=A0A2T0MD22_9FLAO|nr:bifunctional aspartate kinase/homoserine dehydrogenase I [Allomuricauda pacifica]PRX55384.1 aspartate kinase [Allomuricauda pacifica]
MKVLKFGGTSVASPENIHKVKSIIQSSGEATQAVIVSAFGGITDTLLETTKLASEQNLEYKTSLDEIEKRHIDTIKVLIPVKKQSAVLSKVKSDLNTLETLLEGSYLIGEVTPKLSDKIVGYGELLSAFIISEFFISEGLNACFKDSRELIVTDESFGNGKVDFQTTNDNCKTYANQNKVNITILPGFISSSKDGNSTTLGRGGSDYSAAIFASALNADVLEIWTDVSGMYTANPKMVKQAKCISHLSYEEAMELSHFGAKVLYPPTIQPVLDKEIPIVIKNTFSPEDAGTHVSKNTNGSLKTVRGISHVGNISLISLEGPGLIGIPGISKRFFETLSLESISVVLITQASSEHSICVGISNDDVDRAQTALEDTFAYEMQNHRIKPLQIERDLAIVALVGENMKSHQGLSGQMFSTLGKNNVNIRAIAQGASERNISAVIGKKDVKKALNSLHETFFEENIKQLNLFVMGVGNVGAKFIEQIRSQSSYLREELKLNVRVIGMSNSRTMYFNEDGIDLEDWPNDLSKGETANLDTFFERVKQLNFRNSVFVDNTASSEIAQTYSDYLKNSIAVVTCNKIACSSEYNYYQQLKQLAKKYNAPFLFETNVGAGLPIIDTLKHLIVSGDKIHKIQAVLSGSLNFVFNTFDNSTTFHDVVKQAQEEGYTEPDPTIDLSGIDVMRKILILVRESGRQLDIDAIENNGFLPQESLETDSNDAFFESLKKYENDFQELFAEAESNGCKLKYVAQFEDGKASVGLQQIPKGHDFYNLEGSDNIVLFFTERYPNQPLIIKGAGAGADVTASGIFADIIRIGNF